MSAANDDKIDSEQSLTVALHARYLLALEGHRKGAFRSGFFWGFLVAGCLSYLLYKVLNNG